MKEQKKLLRREMERKRSALSELDRRNKSEIICRRAIESYLRPLYIEAQARRGSVQHLSCPTVDHVVQSERLPVLFTYISTQSEVDVAPILEWCWANRVPVAAPRVVSEGRKLTLHVIESFDDLEEGAYGILEPKPTIIELVSLNTIQAMLVPGLAFDPNRGRLGYGGGYYDRFISRFIEETGKEPFKLALAYGVQIVHSVPMDAHDLRVDAVITESTQYGSILSSYNP